MSNGQDNPEVVLINYATSLHFIPFIIDFLLITNLIHGMIQKNITVKNTETLYSGGRTSNKNKCKDNHSLRSLQRRSSGKGHNGKPGSNDPGDSGTGRGSSFLWGPNSL